MSPFHFSPKINDAGNVSENMLRATPRDCTKRSFATTGEEENMDVARLVQGCMHPSEAGQIGVAGCVACTDRGAKDLFERI